MSPSGHTNYEPLVRGAELVDIDKELCRRSLREYLALAWPVIEPSRPFIPGWHTDAICDHLQAVYNGEIMNLVINVPPGSTKSITTSVAFPTWVWTLNPGRKFVAAAYGDGIAFRDARRARELIGHPWYQDRWGDLYKIKPGADQTKRYENDKGGVRQSTTPRGQVTGEHGDFHLVDDPIKPLEVMKSMEVADTALAEVDTWWDGTMSSRVADPGKVRRVITMQRLHEADLAGRMIDRGYEVLMLPMEFEPKRKCFTSIGFEDPRKEEGELLCSERFGPKFVEEQKVALGTRGYQAQYQQNPTPAGGTIIKKAWFKFYHQAPERFRMVIQAWDCSFIDEKTSDFVVGQVWGMRGADFYLLDQLKERLDLVDTCKAIRNMSAKWPNSSYKTIEHKANGPGVISAMRREISGLIPWPAKGSPYMNMSKTARGHVVEPFWEAGNVYIPSPELFSWVDGPDGFVDEITGVPYRKHDDQFDAMTQALIFMTSKKIGRLKQAMENSKAWTR